MRFIILFFVLFISIGCSRKTAPFLVEKTVTHYDTVTLISRYTDTIPCDDFEYNLANGLDSFFVTYKDGILTVTGKYANKCPDIKPCLPRKIKIKRSFNNDESITTPKKLKIDNSVKATKGSAVGDGNKITTKKSNWWWIFLAGMLTWFIIQNVILKTIKRYLIFPL